MSTYPEPVEKLHDMLHRLPGVTAVDLNIQSLEKIGERQLSLPGEFGDLPHVAIRRTGGGLKGEVLVSARIQFRRNQDGWIALEFLAWWVRDLSRSGHLVQMRPIALPPKAYEIQLGRTLQFVIEFFFINTAEDNSAILQQIVRHAESLSGNIDDYAESLAKPVAPDPTDKPVDIESFRRRAEAGDAAGQFSLALCYFQGQGTRKDVKEGARWFAAAAEQGHPAALARLGWCHANGAGVERDMEKAVACYRRAAEAGNPEAMGLLGLCYETGQGVAADPAAAVSWYKKGAEAGDAQAQCFLASCYQQGLGIEADPAEAALWYERSAQKGFARAKMQLGLCHAAGNGLPRDLEKAFALFRETALAGIPFASALLGDCYENGKGVAKDEAEATKWYRLGVEAGDVICEASLGECYEYGRGVQKDLKEALKLYRSALEKGFDPVRPAIERVKQLHPSRDS
jgi:TPR repeat protein